MNGPQPDSSQADAGPEAANRSDRTSGHERDRPEPGEGRAPADRPGPARRQVEREPAGRSGEPPDEAEQPTPEGLRRDDAFTQADPGGPAGEVMGDDLDRQPGAVRRELA